MLILGIGNYLMGDEGIGVHTARRLQNHSFFDDIDVVDGGTGGFHLLAYFENYPTVILIDATLNDKQEEGCIQLIKPKFAHDFPKAMSTHDIGLKDMVSALQLLDRMPEIYLFTVNIKSLQQQGIELTPALQIVMPKLISKIKELVTVISERTVTNIHSFKPVLL